MSTEFHVHYEELLLNRGNQRKARFSYETVIAENAEIARSKFKTNKNNKRKTVLNVLEVK